jgi:hypothetical protein
MESDLMCCRTCKWHRYPDEPPNYVKNNHVCIRLPVFAVVYNVKLIDTMYCGEYVKKGE